PEETGIKDLFGSEVSTMMSPCGSIMWELSPGSGNALCILFPTIFLKSIPPGIDEADCDPEEEIRLIEKLLYDNSSPRPPKEFNYENVDAVIESFSSSPIPFEDSDPFMEEIDLFLTSDGSIPPVSVRCQKPGHLAARLGCAETKVATWDDLFFKLIILGWNVKHINFAKR
nr:hypothetical protein [Tanacetum cinerariifolium]